MPLSARNLAERLDDALAEVTQCRQAYEANPSSFTMQEWDNAKAALAGVLSDLKQWTLEP